MPEPTQTATAEPTQTETPTPIHTATPTHTAPAVPTGTPPSLTLSQSSGSFKDAVIAKGAHFGGHEPVALYLDNTASTPLTRTVTGGGGTFTATFGVPQARLRRAHTARAGPE